jgi:hypothetical protein
MNRKIAVLFYTLLATHLAAADPVAPPPQAAAAGFLELGFDEDLEVRRISDTAPLATNGTQACGGNQLRRRALFASRMAF